MNTDVLSIQNSIYIQIDSSSFKTAPDLINLHITITYELISEIDV